MGCGRVKRLPGGGQPALRFVAQAQASQQQGVGRAYGLRQREAFAGYKFG